MKIVCLKGGLGNQLFEYCRYRQLLDDGRERVWLYLDPRRLKSHRGALLTEGFDVRLPRVPLLVHALVLGVKLLRELHLFPHIYDDERDDCLLIDDYSQQRRFLTRAIDYLPFRQLSLSPSAQAVRSLIAATPDSTFVHVRRGDYLHPTNLPHFGLCTLDYYAAAVRLVRQQHPSAHLFVFSDDIEWARRHLTFPSATFVTHDPADADVVDLYLMSLCRHHVLANSTFSFWAAHLSAPGGITVYPSRWFADPIWQVPDIFPEHWLGLDTPLSTLAAP